MYPRDPLYDELGVALIVFGHPQYEPNGTNTLQVHLLFIALLGKYHGNGPVRTQGIVYEFN